MRPRHKTRSVFDRVHIVSELDLRQAAEKLDVADRDSMVTVTPKRASRGSRLEEDFRTDVLQQWLRDPLTHREVRENLRRVIADHRQPNAVLSELVNATLQLDQLRATNQRHRRRTARWVHLTSDDTGIGIDSRA